MNFCSVEDNYLFEMRNNLLINIINESNANINLQVDTLLWNHRCDDDNDFCTNIHSNNERRIIFF